uniref:Putative evasin n=1 Tax=Rhipicephalus pulchellus TaxID=72859 RepID=L7MAE2_RHIPC
MRNHLAVFFAFFSVAVIMITDGHRPHRPGPAGGLAADCSTYNCTLYKNRTQDGCPDHCRCSGLVFTNEFPKKGFCAKYNGGFRYPNANSTSEASRGRGSSTVH